jgi:hydrogenase maturation protease
MQTTDRSAPRTVVLGLGNPLMGDDGVGLAALSLLAGGWTFEPSVELIDGGTWGMNLLHLIEGADQLILLDAIDAGDLPGTPVVLEREDLPRRLSAKLSPHQIDLAEVLALAALRGKLPPRLVALGLQPAQIELSTEISSEVRRSLPKLVALAIERLKEWGHEPRRLTRGAGEPAPHQPLAARADPCTS